jgi:hypothetical protein
MSHHKGRRNSKRDRMDLGDNGECNPRRRQEFDLYRDVYSNQSESHCILCSIPVSPAHLNKTKIQHCSISYTVQLKTQLVPISEQF